MIDMSLDRHPGRTFNTKTWATPRLVVFGSRFLTATAIVGTLCIVLFLLPLLFGLRPTVFLTGSMSPAIDAGAVAWTKETPANELQIGDVVTVINKDDQPVSHRIVAITPQGDQVALTLKGDANNVPDFDQYVVASAPRVVFDVPYIGYVLKIASTPIGGFLGALYLVAIVYLGFRVDKHKRLMAGAGTLAVVMLAGSLYTGKLNSFTQALFSDQLAMTTGNFDSGTIPSVGITFCTASGTRSGNKKLVITHGTITNTRLRSTYKLYWADGASSTDTNTGTQYTLRFNSSGQTQVDQNYNGWVATQKDVAGSSWESVISNTITYNWKPNTTTPTCTVN